VITQNDTPYELVGLAALSLPDLVYRDLWNAIVSGRIATGTPLRQQEIALRMGISRLPVREALRRLEGEGLAVLRPRRGYAANTLDRNDIHDLFEIQAMLEERAGSLAALNRTPDDLNGIETSLAHIDGLLTVSSFDVVEYGHAVTAFHMRFIAAAHRPYLVRVAQKSRCLLERYVRLAADDHCKSKLEHCAMVRALRLGDAKATGRLCRNHIEAAQTRLDLILGKSGFPAVSSISNRTEMWTSSPTDRNGRKAAGA